MLMSVTQSMVQAATESMVDGIQKTCLKHMILGSCFFIEETRHTQSSHQNKK